jgi:hypothetical protein
MNNYAANTTVSVESSQEHIKRTLRRYGASRFGVFEDMESTMKASVMFSFAGLDIRIDVEMPGAEDQEFHVSEAGRQRKPAAAYAAYEQAIRRRWRCLLLAIKAKLEAVETGISTVDIEFMPFIVMGDGRTVGEHLLPSLLKAAELGKMPRKLLVNKLEGD